ncbi:hypothetical protein RLIN73S_05383 [Rhodanobacter lindaniclasticus]
MGVGAVHGLAQSVFDHVAKHKPWQVGIGPDHDPQFDRLADVHKLDGSAFFIQQGNVLDDGLSGSGNGLHSTVLASARTDRGIFLFRDQGVVEVHHLFRVAILDKAPPVEQQRAAAQALDSQPVVGDDQKRGPLLLKLADALETFVLKVGVTDGKRLVHDQQLWPECRGNTEGHTHLHTTGVGPHRLVEVLADFGELLDGINDAVDLLPRKPHQAGGVIHVLPSRQIWIETHTKLKDRGDAARGCNGAFGRPKSPRDQLQQRALASPVLTDHTDRLARGDAEGYASQYPSFVLRSHAHAEP